MTPFQEIVRLKVERKKALNKRRDDIDQLVEALEPQLTHEEAVFIVKKYESAEKSAKFANLRVNP